MNELQKVHTILPFLKSIGLWKKFQTFDLNKSEELQTFSLFLFSWNNI